MTNNKGDNYETETDFKCIYLYARVCIYIIYIYIYIAGQCSIITVSDCIPATCYMYYISYLQRVFYLPSSDNRHFKIFNVQDNFCYYCHCFKHVWIF